MLRYLMRLSIWFTILNPALIYSQEKDLPYFHTIDSLMDVAYELEFSNPDSAIHLYNEIARMAEIEADWLRKGRTHNYRAIVYFELGDYDQALIHNQLALELFERANYIIGVASIKINIGNIRLYYGDYNDAVKLYYEGIEIYKLEEDTLRLMTSYMNIGTLFYQNDYLQEALNYYSQALVWAKKIGYRNIMSDLHYNIGNTLFRMNIFDQYRYHLDTAIIYAEETDFIYGKVNIYNSLLRYYRLIGDENEAFRYTHLAIESATIYGNPFNLAETYNAAGATYLLFNKTGEAYSYLNQALKLARNFNYKQILSETLLNLSGYYANSNNYQQAYNLLSEYTQLADSIFTIEKQKELQELDRKYQLVKKESELKDQQLTIELKEREIYRKNRVITSSTAFIVFILVTMFLSWKIQDKKKKLVSKELERLKTEREKDVVKALLEGEEKERTRIARELHDGINGNLATLKLNMTSLQNDSYNRLIDETMEDIRNLSHNLMPEVVVKFGLREALEQYINHMGHGNEVNFHYQFIGDSDEISSETAVHSYRIVQELVNNSLKHAEAGEINVQLIVNNGKLSIAVEDNGKGFEISMAGKHPPNAGIGLSNVENRITFLQGNFDIHSSTDSGTSIHIEIPLKKMYNDTSRYN
jgi:two-component system, NarL family, sensor kinase